MRFSGRRLLLALAFLVAVAAVVLLLTGTTAGWIGWAMLGGAAILYLAVLFLQPAIHPVRRDPPDIADLDDERLRELARGTGLHLRNMDYRYSIRIDGRASGDRKPFMAEVNSVKLGFVPAIITENASDRQGHGYVAFVYHEDRWRGPGLPCPDGQAEAVKHAGRCVSPLAREDETFYEDTED